MTLCIIDTALHAAPNATRASAAADLIVIPCRPTALDLAVVGSAVEIVTAAKKPGVFILSGCPPRAPEIEEKRTVLAEYGLPVSPVSITDRRAFARAVASGRAVTKFDGNGKAAKEIRLLWHWRRGN
jgi:chromosome partitioning protein